MKDKKLLGDLGEEFAAGMLYAEGYEILERKFRSYSGEIDIVCEKGGTIYFVEVKTRTSKDFGDPGDAVGKEKAKRMTKTAWSYLYFRKREDADVSFKVMEILVRETDDDFLFM